MGNKVMKIVSPVIHCSMTGVLQRVPKVVKRLTKQFLPKREVFKIAQKVFQHLG